MGWFAAIAKFFSALGEIMGLVKHRSELNNAPEVQDMEKRRDEEKAQDEAQKAVGKKDTKRVRNLLGCFLALAIVTGCNTVTPGTVKSKQAALDGNEANSGFIGFNKDGSGVITDGARMRYNALVARYGSRFLVPITEGHGLSPDAVAGHWRITAEALEKFITMNRWFKEGR